MIWSLNLEPDIRGLESITIKTSCGGRLFQIPEMPHPHASSGPDWKGRFIAVPVRQCQRITSPRTSSTRLQNAQNLQLVASTRGHGTPPWCSSRFYKGRNQRINAKTDWSWKAREPPTSNMPKPLTAWITIPERNTSNYLWEIGYAAVRKQQLHRHWTTDWFHQKGVPPRKAVFTPLIWPMQSAHEKRWSAAGIKDCQRNIINLMDYADDTYGRSEEESLIYEIYLYG